MVKQERHNSYVYSHTRLDTNEVFYIGIGTGRNYYRSKDKSRRNEHWNRIVAKSEYKIDILFDNLTWIEATKKEIEFIAFYGRTNQNKGTLVNQTDGGDGTYGVEVKESTKRLLTLIGKGRIMPESHKKKTSESVRISWEKRRIEGKTISNNKEIICLNNGKKYISGMQAANELGLSHGNISAVIKGIRKHTKGYIFKFAS
jgi:hypothetical protein